MFTLSGSEGKKKKQREGRRRAHLDEGVHGENDELRLRSSIVDEVEVDEFLLLEVVGLLEGGGSKRRGKGGGGKQGVRRGGAVEGQLRGS